MPVEIVPIERRHIAGFRDVLDAVAREQRYLAMVEAPSLTQVRRFVLTGLRDGMVQFVAVDDGRVVGWCDVRPKPRELTRHSGVLGMGIAASHRGIGIGSRLLDATLAVAIAGGLTRIELHVLVDNEPAIALYRRFGFETEGTCRHYLRQDGTYRDALLMAKLGGK
jgi:ribosomal protein S18 acetylase RimI-like enzyme